jgi:hypothetical protein
MIHFLRKTIVFALTGAITLAAIPPSLHAGGEIPSGADSAEQAASPDLKAFHSQKAVPGRWNGSYAAFDTTGYDFPEEEEEKRNIVKEVAIWVGVAAFVAFFVIKVFLEGDTDETPTDDGGGKDVPPIVPAPGTAPAP